MFRNARRIVALAIVAAALPVASASAATTYSGGVTVAAGDVTGATIPTQPTAYMKIVLEDVIVSSATAGSTGREQTSLGIAVEVEPEAIALLLPAVQKIREAAAR